MAGLVCHLDRCCHHFYSPLEKIYSDDKELTCSSTKPHVGFCDSIAWVKVFRPVTDFRLCASQSGCSCDSCRSALKKIGGG